MKEDKKYIYNSGDTQIVTSGTGNIIRVVPKYDMWREQGLPEVEELSEEEIDKGLLQGERCEQLLRVGDYLKCDCGSKSHQIGGEGITGVTDCKGREILTAAEIPLRLRLHEDGYFGKCTSNHTRMLRYNDECHPLIIGNEWIQPEENLTAGNERLVRHEKSKLACRFFGTISSDEIVSEYEVSEEEMFQILDLYLEGHLSDTEVEEILKKLAENQTLDVYTETIQNPSEDFQRYDHMVIGWTKYYNDRLGINIDTAIIKAIMYKESRMGYAKNSSPNANADDDVMQTLDPRNPTIYGYCTYELDGSKNVKIEDEDGKRVLPGTLSSKYVHKKTSAMYNTPVVDRLFKLKSDGYYYQYQNASPVLSIAMGIKTYSIKLAGANGDPLIAAQNYNGSKEKVGYMKNVEGLAFKGGNNRADNYIDN